MKTDKGVGIVQPGGGKSTVMAGDRYTVLLDGGDTGGRFSLVHAEVPPGGGPIPHRHGNEDETFHVLRGRVHFWAEGDIDVTAEPGTTVHLPRGVAHQFRNDSGESAEMLIQLTPAGQEQFFLEVGTADGPLGRMDEAEIRRAMTAAPKYGIEFLPPDHFTGGA